MTEWQRFRDRPPTAFELQLWQRWPDANVGIALGSPAADGLRLLAVDVDTTDPDELDAIIRALPPSPMVKRGLKGETRFYRAPAEIKSKGYKVPTGEFMPDGKPKRRTLVDLLTGSQTRQSVVPPSVHPDGPTYVWTAGPVPAAELPIFDEGALSKLEETLEAQGWGAAETGATADRPSQPPREDRDPDASPTIWRDLNDEALGKLEAWVPALDLYRLHAARGGYEAVATWRGSSSGQAAEKRKRNLKIHPSGIRDMGDDRTYTALDLIQAATSCNLDTAFGWLSVRLGHATAPVVLQPASGASDIDNAARSAALAAAKQRKTGDELPDALTHPGGLVEEITDWIAATARRPSRVLALGAALVIVGTAAGRQFAGPTRSGTHLYVLPLAPTGAGKDWPLQAIGKFLDAAGLKHLSGPSQFISMPAVVKHLTSKPLSVCPQDEFGAFLKRINNRRASGFESQISGELRRVWATCWGMYSTPEWASTLSRAIYSPALSIYGPSTPEEFYGALTQVDATNGLLNRFLLLGTAVRAPSRSPPLDPGKVPEAILEKLRAIYFAKGALYAASLNSADTDCEPDVLAWGAGAEAIFDGLNATIDGRSDDDPVAAAFMSRTGEQAIRIATIIALGRDGPTACVTARDVELGRDLAMWSAETMLAGAAEHMADSEVEARLNRVRAIVRQEGVIARSRLLKRSKLLANDLEAITRTLVATGEIVTPQAAVVPGRNGPAPTEYAWVGG
jgi:hypothetical protein